MSRIYLLYHFFHPDDVISARLYSDLAIALTNAGYEVVALPSIRSCHANAQRYPAKENWEGGSIRRIWRPNFQQSSNLGRLLNTLFMLVGWAWTAATYGRLKRSPKREIVIVGTDPIFGVLATIPWRLFRKRSTIIHWCHDVHPEATLADGAISENSLPVRILRRILRIAYRRCDAVVDLGSCMRRLVQKAGNWTDDNSRRPMLTTITPWSLVELESVPIADKEVRFKLFGDCRMAFLYSGNLGRAHEVENFLNLARICREDGFHFCFAGRGQGIDSLNARLTTEDSNISFAGFADESELQKRLSACDVHLVSLKESWTGTVVPSKFFGALSNGRPVLFSGSRQSCIAEWIDEYSLGWNLNAENTAETRARLIEYTNSASLKDDLQHRCWNVYQQNFSKAAQMKRWLSVVSLVEPSE